MTQTLQLIILVCSTIAAVLGLFSVITRALESVYQLSQTPGLNTLGKCIQVVRNFFKIEKYEVK